MCLHVFFDKRPNTLSVWLFLFVFFFPDEIAFSSILAIRMIFFGYHSILRENKSQLASTPNFELARWYNLLLI